MDHDHQLQRYSKPDEFLMEQLTESSIFFIRVAGDARGIIKHSLLIYLVGNLYSSVYTYAL